MDSYTKASTKGNFSTEIYTVLLFLDYDIILASLHYCSAAQAAQAPSQTVKLHGEIFYLTILMNMKAGK